MNDDRINNTVSNWRKRLERIQSRGRKSVHDSIDGKEHSYGLYEWLELNDIIQEMDMFINPGQCVQTS